MKRLYLVKIMRGENFDFWEYNVVAANGDEASRKAKRQAIKDSGFGARHWRLYSLAEKPERVVS